MNKNAMYVGALTLGIVVGAGGAVIWSGRIMADTVYEMKAMELSRSFLATASVASATHPETAIWVLDRHLELIAEFREMDYPKSELDDQAMMTHARLAREWQELGDADKVSDHVRLGIDLAQTSDTASFRRITTRDKFLAFSAGIDDPSKRSLLRGMAESD